MSSTYFNAFHPLSPAASMADRVMSRKVDFAEFAADAQPVFMTKGASPNFHSIECPAFLWFQLRLAKPTRSHQKLYIRAQFRTEIRSHCWSLNLDLRVPRKSSEPLEAMKVTAPGKTSAGTESDFSAQIFALASCLEALFEGPVASEMMEVDFQGSTRRLEVQSFAETSARNFRAAHHRQAQSKQDLETDHAQRLNRLANGTPLMMRGGSLSTTWSLGVKQGNLAKAVAAHACVPSPEVLLSDELRKAGLSRHRALHLFANARTALDLEPAANDFPRSRKRRRNPLNLDPRRPFHASFGITKDDKERRAQGPTVWIETSFPHLSRAFFINRNEDFTHYSKLTSKGIHPNYPGWGFEPDIFCLTRKPGIRNQIALRDFDKPCGMTIVSQAAAEVLWAHDLGRTELKPLLMVDADGRAEEPRYLLVMREDHPCIDVATLMSDIAANIDIRAIEHFEISARLEEAQGLDLWIDSRINPVPLMLSARLKSALSKAGVSPPKGLKRLDIL